MNDQANFIALIEAHEKLLALVKSTASHYFKEAVELNGTHPERAELIGSALDDLHIPIENNLKRLRASLHNVEMFGQRRKAPENTC